MVFAAGFVADVGFQLGDVQVARGFFAAVSLALRKKESSEAYDLFYAPRVE